MILVSGVAVAFAAMFISVADAYGGLPVFQQE
jgi:hypothetical protein